MGTVSGAGLQLGSAGRFGGGGRSVGTQRGDRRTGCVVVCPHPAGSGPVLPASVALAPAAVPGLRLAGGHDIRWHFAGDNSYRAAPGGDGLGLDRWTDMGIFGRVVLCDPGAILKHRAAEAAGLRTSDVPPFGRGRHRVDPGNLRWLPRPGSSRLARRTARHGGGCNRGSGGGAGVGDHDLSP